MNEILYRNDKKRLILYELLMLERKLTKSEASEYKRLKAARTEADEEKRELLKELISGGYVDTPDGMQIGEHTFTSDVLHQRKRITPTGIDLLKKELPSELKEERYKRVRRIVTDIYAVVATLIAIFEFVWFTTLGN